MTQIEKLTARVAQAIAQSRNGIMTIQIPIVNGVPVFWVIQAPGAAEGCIKIISSADEDGIVNGV